MFCFVFFLTCLPCHPQITLPWAEQQVQEARSFRESISFLQSLASQSPLGEITLNLVTVTSPAAEMDSCVSA